MAAGFKDFLQNVSVVLKAADESLQAFQTKIPVDFYEDEPPLIGSYFLKYISDNPDFKTTTVSARLDQLYYTSVYPLYHDIRLSAFILLHQLEIGSDHYVDIDRLYKFATEFLLRESARLNIEDISKNFPERKEDLTDFGVLVAQDFIKISTTYSLSNTEAFYIPTQNNIPLFSSSNQRSSLDEREISPPDAFSFTQILPHAYVPNFHNFSSITPNRQQSQSLSQAEILSRFLHPNWYSLPTSKWLEGSDLQSFAPLVDQQSSVVTSSDKARLWFEHIGLKKHLAEQGEKESRNNEEQLRTSQDVDVEATQEELTQSSQLPSAEISETGEIGSISLENLYEWEPFNEIEDDEMEAFKNGDELELVSKLLKDLQSQQQLRLKSSSENNKPLADERKLYFKIKRILREIALNAKHLPEISISTSLPVLQTDYPGTLPVPTQNVNNKKKNKSRR